ncbi:hypothetical protein N0V90_008753 [Kalmusia sp. IMI 367209]|nr:hypothetical protein N0V90_008753 [Kalmusia sp. IMI 367209]
MDTVPIAELKPELLALDSKHIRGVVTLIWPYSSSARQFAFLLGDPDFRLRRKNGQVRVRFSGSSARAIASTGVGIGDEVVLSLRGAEFVKDSSISTPGKSIDWELAYTQTLSSRIRRDSTELANLDLFDVAPTPAPRSPVRAPPRSSIAAADEARQWSSPAFLKRIRLSDGPVLKPAYDPFADDIEDGHATKRRRKSYRDWGAWTYLARTPSPAKEDVDTDMDGDSSHSPIRPTQLPDTPVSPSRPPLASKTAKFIDGSVKETDTEHVGLGVEGRRHSEVGDSESEEGSPGIDASLYDFVRDADYYDLYAGPDEQPPTNTYHLEGDTEPNTEDDEVNIVEAQEIQYPDLVANDAEEAVDRFQDSKSSDFIEILSDSEASDPAANYTTHPTKEQGLVEIEVTDTADDSPANEVLYQRKRGRSGTNDDPISLDDSPQIIMPPPTLPLLQTDFQNAPIPGMSGMLTPIGKEPSSPNLQPLDSSTLPMPSPFPGEREGNVTSFLDYVGPSQQLDHKTTQAETDQNQPEVEADYIVESSFYSSIGSSSAPAFQPTHESAFTDVRFTFGMDGSAFLRSKTSVEQDDSLGTQDAHHEAAQTAEELDTVSNQQSSPISVKESITNSNEPLGLPQNMTTYPLSPSREQATEESIDISSGLEVERAEHTEQPIVEVDVRDDDDDNGKNQMEFYDGRNSTSSVNLDQGHAHHIEQDPSVHGIAEGTVVDEIFGLSQGSATSGEAMQQSIAISEIIDFGSPSDDSEAGEDSNESLKDSSEAIIEDLTDEEPRWTRDSDTQEVPVQVEQQPEEGNAISEIPLKDGLPPADYEQDTPITQGSFPSEHIKLEPIEDIPVDEESGMIAGTSDNLLPDSNLFQQDVKMESIEEPFSSLTEGANTLGRQDEESAAEPASELLIAVPDEGDKLGELHLVSVPDTVPARNTRSKTKPSPENEAHIVPRTTRSRKKGALAPLFQTKVSPSATRSTSTTSPTTETFSTSPYSLRSQSKHISPTKSIISPATRTGTRRRSTQPKSSAEPSPQQMSFTQVSLRSGEGVLHTDFNPSQELQTFESNFTNVPSVKHSEEDSLQSLSKVQYSDSQTLGMDTTFSDSADPNTKVREQNVTPRKALVANHRFSPASPTQQSGSQVAVTQKRTPTKSSSPLTVQPPLNSPIQSLRSVTPTDVARSSPRRSRRINKDMSDVLMDVDMPNARNTDATERGSKAIYPVLPTADEESEIRSSPPARLLSNERVVIVADGGEQTSKSSLVGKTQEASANLQSLIDNHLLITPEATQQTTLDSQQSVPAMQEQSLPITPQLTQSTSTAIHSSKANDVETKEIKTEFLAKPSPDIASSDPPVSTQNEPPSVGLSTPVAYYTPLRDLPYFLNRSSNFHSGGSPDILALVTTPNTPPIRATRGPKHHTTTIHITDLSIYPSQTTVQVFRAYANALPIAVPGDVVLLRAFNVKSLNRHPCLVSADESAWCVWRYGKPLLGKKRGSFAEVKAREEVNGPEVERGEGEWQEVGRLREWYMGTVKAELEEKEHRTRSNDVGTEGGNEEGASQP